jgi:hypothetical protein
LEVGILRRADAKSVASASAPDQPAHRLATSDPHQAPDAEPGHTGWKPGGRRIPDFRTLHRELTENLVREVFQLRPGGSNRHLEYIPVAPNFHRDADAQPDIAEWKPGTGSLLQKSLFPMNFCRSVEAI